MRLDKNGYIERRTSTHKNPTSKAVYRNWWLVKNTGPYSVGISFRTCVTLYMPRELLGKRVRLKLEVME